jgi:hypothetical protein
MKLCNIAQRSAGQHHSQFDHDDTTADRAMHLRTCLSPIPDMFKITMLAYTIFAQDETSTFLTLVILTRL